MVLEFFVCMDATCKYHSWFGLGLCLEVVSRLFSLENWFISCLTATGLVQRLIFNLTCSSIQTHRIVFRANVCDLFVTLDQFFKSNYCKLGYSCIITSDKCIKFICLKTQKPPYTVSWRQPISQMLMYWVRRSPNNFGDQCITWQMRALMRAQSSYFSRLSFR